MTSKPSISSIQLLLLLALSYLMIPFTRFPAITSMNGNQDVWIAIILSLPYTLILSIPVLFLANKFKGIGFNDILKLILGKFAGPVVSILFALFLIFVFILMTMLSVIFINAYIFTETPSWSILLFILVPIAYAACQGAGAIARLSAFFVSFIIIIMIFFFAAGFNGMDFSLLKPVLADSSFKNINLNALLTTASGYDVLILLVFSAYLHRKVKINKTYLWALTIFTALYVLIAVSVITTLGMDIAKHALNPYYLFSRQVKAYEFIQRVEIFNTVGWFLGMLVKISLFNFMASDIISGVFKAKSYRITVIVLSAAAFFIAVYPKVDKSTMVETLFSYKYYPFISGFFMVVLPLILMLFYLFRRKKINKRLESIRQKAGTTG
jgi:spore germination protein (amino acid permease)